MATRRYSSEYKDFRPYIIEDIRLILGGGARAGSAGSSGSGLEAHTLANTSIHIGPLDDAQAPQFLMRDGSRSLTGNLPVAAGVTIDGVDLSAHVLDPDAHHPRQHGILSSADHTVTGAQYQIIGLTGTNALGLLTPSFNPGAAAAILRTDTAGKITLRTVEIVGDLYMTGVLDFGANTMYEDATYLQVTGSKAVRFAQNIGNANWTVYAAGGATFRGNVDILAGGDLTVAGSGAYAGVQVLMVDSSGGNVGINRAPDPQFALDIAGPARADYWIGPHAIQLANALMICHYDGPESTTAGELNGHMGQVGVATGGVVFRPGKFGKAVQVARSTVNRLVDPSCEYDAGMSLWYQFNVTATRSADVAPLYGSYVGKLVTGAGAAGILYQTLTPTGASVHLMAYVRKADGSAVTAADASIYFGADVTTTYADVGGGWWRLVYSTNAAALVAAQVGVRVQAGRTVYVDGLQMAQQSAYSPYVDGSLGVGHAWTGAAHASTSTRAAGNLSYTLNTIRYDKPVTIMGWVRTDVSHSTGFRYLWWTGGDAYSAYLMGSVLIVGGVDCGTPPAGWYHVALVTAGDAVVHAYVNGVFKGSTAGISRGNLSEISVGGQNGANTSNALIDDFAVIGAALPAGTLLSVYSSDAPVFAESSVWSFRATAKGLVWGDDEGLWVRDTAGNPVLGVYAGEAASKSWGSFSLGVGDLVIGYNAVGSAAIRWTKASGKFGFYGAGNGTPQVEIAVDGSVLAGAGGVRLGSYGLGVYPAGATSPAAGINAGGFWMDKGGPRTTGTDWSTGARLHSAYGSEFYEADTEVFSDGGSDYQRNALVVRNSAWTDGAGIGTAYVEISAYNSSNSNSSRIILNAGLWSDMYSTAYGTAQVIEISAHTVLFGLPTRLWMERGVYTIEWMRFTGTVGTSNPISTAALGAYAGKLKINVNGTDRWIPYYAS